MYMLGEVSGQPIARRRRQLSQLAQFPKPQSPAINCPRRTSRVHARDVVR